MNTRNSVKILSPNNKEEVCAEFTITDTSIPFVFENEVNTVQNNLGSFSLLDFSNLNLIGEYYIQAVATYTL